MIDISQTVAPKSDQLNADDLIGGPRTVTVTRVSKMKEPDQPIAIYFEGDNGNPWVVAVTFSVHARNIDQLAPIAEAAE